MKFRKDMLTLYAVTERSDRADLGWQVEEAIKGGVTMVQLREKELPEDAFVEEAVYIKKICEKYKVPFIINDNLEVALKSKADGIHVGISDMPVQEIRKKAGENFIIGATAKTIEQAVKAEAEGADYLGVGAVFPSPTKKDAIRITKEQLKQITGAVKIPAVAIGGIHLGNAEELTECGICGIAVVSAVFSAEDSQDAARKLKEKAERICGYESSIVHCRK